MHDVYTVTPVHVDTLYVGQDVAWAGGSGELAELLRAELQRGRELRAQGAGREAEVPILVGGEPFRLLGGAARYDAVLEGRLGKVYLRVSEGAEELDNPEVRWEFYSEPLHRLGPEGCLARARRWVEQFGTIQREIVSRLDLTVDLIGLDVDLYSEVLPRAVCRGRRRNVLGFEEPENVQVVGVALEAHTLYFGGSSGRPKCRIYRKDVELRVQHGRLAAGGWLAEWWRAQGTPWDGRRPVVRVEFELHRPWLVTREPAIDTTADLAHVGSIWAGLTNGREGGRGDSGHAPWLRVVDPVASRSGDCPTAAWWRAIAAAAGGAPPVRAAAERPPAVDGAQLVAQAIGCLGRAAALAGLSDAGLRELLETHVHARACERARQLALPARPRVHGWSATHAAWLDAARLDTAAESCSTEPIDAVRRSNLLDNAEESPGEIG